MCLIFSSNKGNLPDKEQLRIAHENNPDGVGFMWLDDKTVRAVKGLYNFTDLWNMLSLMKGRPYACHLRYRTRGKISPSTCHPFRIRTSRGSAYVMHNGTIFGIKTFKNGMSDTQIFAMQLEDTLEEIGNGYQTLHSRDFLDTVGASISEINKLVFMTPRGLTYINKKASGTFNKNGIWYSNSYSFIKGYRDINKVTPELISAKKSTKKTIDDFNDSDFSSPFESIATIGEK